MVIQPGPAHAGVFKWTVANHIERLPQAGRTAGIACGRLVAAFDERDERELGRQVGRAQFVDHVAEQRQQEQGRAEHAAQGREPTVEPAALVQPAPSQETGKAITGGGEQAGEGAHQQWQVERHRAGTGQDASLFSLLNELQQELAATTNVRLDNLKYDQKNSELRFQAEADSFQRFDNLKTRLEQKGFEVKQGALSNEGGKVQGTVAMKVKA